MEASVNPRVRFIAPKIGRAAPTVQKTVKRKVAGYARVSTDMEEQQTSYAAQVDYYTNFIKARPDWEFVRVYTDEGISATSTRHREGFQEMVRDALAGRIDLIVTKSVSRFARNTVDSLTTIRELKAHGTEVFFEKEGIWTFDTKGELLITIMSSLAQEESRSISENVRWGQRKKFSDGRYSLNYPHFLGYDKGPEGKLVINQEQAQLVRRIYGMFLKGHSPYQIAKNLTDEGIPTPAGKKKWSYTTIRRVLSNETYMGDKLLQKTYSIDFLSKDRLKNHGEVPQYYVEGDHEAIIPSETFKRVQAELEKRKGRHSTGSCVFSGRIYCAQCGQIYGSKTWHSNNQYRRVVWQCNSKFSGIGEAGPKLKCTTPTLTEEQIKEAFEQVLAKLALGREEIIANLREVQSEVGDVSQLEAERVILVGKHKDVDILFQQEITRNASVAQDQDAYNARYDELVAEGAMLDEKIAELDAKITEKQRNAERIDLFIQSLEQAGEAFTEDLWCIMVDTVTVSLQGGMKFCLTCGMDVEV